VSIRLGAKLPHSGSLPARLGLVTMAQRLEKAGFDSMWVSDHVVFPEEVRSRYPFAANGRPTWSMDVDYIEPIVALSAVAPATTKAELGTSVLILPMRNPVIFAKQAACIDVLSGGRLVLGVGVGWLREEFEALGAEFDARGAVLDEWLEIARACWSGSAGPHEGRHYRLQEAIYCRPVPTRKPPVLIGGMSKPALERAGRTADGWVAQFSMDDIAEDKIAGGLAIMRSTAAQPGKSFRVVVRVTGADRRTSELARRLDSLAGAGATDVVVDVDWSGEDGPERSVETLRAAVA
jgi:probable F420-dependent oxidoreductase